MVSSPVLMLAEASTLSIWPPRSKFLPRPKLPLRSGRGFLPYVRKLVPKMSELREKSSNSEEFMLLTAGSSEGVRKRLLPSMR